MLRLLHRRPQLTRAEIARQLGLARSTVSETLAVLLDEGAVVVARTEGRIGRGRPAEVLSLDPRAGFYLGVEIAYQRITVLVTNARHEVIGRSSRPCAATSSWPDRLALSVEMTEQLATAGLVEYHSLRGVAVGLPGQYSHSWSDGSCPARFDDVGRLARDLFGARRRAPVVVDLHVRFAALAEAAARDCPTPDLLYLRLSTGVGAALVSDGRIVRGRGGRAGELGHVVVADGPAGRQCRCGTRGCLETIASVPAVVQACRDAGLPASGLADVAAGFATGDPIINDVIDAVVTALATVTGTVIAAVAPEEIVLAGELPTALGPDFVARVEAAVATHAFPRTEPPRVSAALLGDDAAALGAVTVLRQDLMPHQFLAPPGEFS